MSLIDRLVQNNILQTQEIIAAFKKIKRSDFLPRGLNGQAELDMPISIGFGQTISQPSTVAFMLELLQPHSGDKIMDVGSGSGWTLALLAQIIASGKVYGIEIKQELASFAENNVLKYNFISKGTVKVFCQDGWQGLPDLAPFDKIIVAAAASEIPQALLKQLRIGGRLVLPVGDVGMIQDLLVIEKTAEDQFSKKIYSGFVFVPLVKKE
ncbi:MAG: Protein-L-isoaspartate O-methyltransferase [Candidatus Falkowbacteria bacterium GW2011_GWF2_39_8]|uniref:Protein-L-isoaspartate O-methyltransferase n=1 Tax=Candidatus Falkowbacteria bacterium GW2011_GWF2_39_8 TaxID=1618642 RepID=A0A0G0PTL8_9BACT|nr:MAG: Protein-L-isoaspartate O-methyltransferase [Candidatus Falkowbacteria bacterium GW2011_GWF2_39_8]